MQNILDAGREVMRRFIAAAKDKEQRFGNWRTLFSDPEVVQSRQVVLEKKMADVEAERERWEALLSDSLTPEQRMLQEQMAQADEEMDVVGEEAYDDAVRRYEESIEKSTNPKQAEYLREIKRLEKAYSDLDNQDVRQSRLAKYALTCDMPKAVEKQDKFFATAVRKVVEVAFNMQRFGREYRDFSDADYAVIHSEYEERKFGLGLYNGSGSTIDLDAVERVLAGSNIEKQLSDPDKWRRVNTQRGIGYIIECKTNKAGLVNDITFEAVNSLKQMSQYAGQCQQAFVVDGVIMSGKEYSSKREREAESEEPALQHDTKRRIILTSEAAKDILGALGVDINRIKGAEQSRG